MSLYLATQKLTIPFLTSRTDSENKKYIFSLQFG